MNFDLRILDIFIGLFVIWSFLYYWEPRTNAFCHHFMTPGTWVHWFRHPIAALFNSFIMYYSFHFFIDVFGFLGDFLEIDFFIVINIYIDPEMVIHLLHSPIVMAILITLSILAIMRFL